MAEQTGKPAIVEPEALDDGTISITGMPQRRRFPRYPFSATVRVTDLETKARVDGRTSDLSVGGCYVDALATLRIGSKVQVHIEHGEKILEVVANITYAHEGLGMGVMFTEIKPKAQDVLSFWIAELSGEELPVQSMEIPGVEGIDNTSDMNLRRSIIGLIQLLVHNQIISPSDGAALVRQASG
jgi:hypothetical protein